MPEEPSFSNISMLLNSPGPSLYQSQVSTGLSCGQMTYGSRQPTFDCAASTRQSSKEREARCPGSGSWGAARSMRGAEVRDIGARLIR